MPDDLSGELMIDEFTPLPEGLSLNGDVISGSVEKPVNKFIHVLVKNGNDIYGTRLEMVIAAVANEGETEDYVDPVNPEPEQPKKKGCFGSVEVTLASLVLFSVAAISILVFDRKRKIAK